MEGLAYALEHRDETLRLTGKVANLPADHPMFTHMYDEVKSKGYISVTAAIPRAKIEWLQNEMLKLGDMKKRVDVDRHIDESVRLEALRRVSAPAK